MTNEKIRVLIVDDNIDFCYVCTNQLKTSEDIVCCGIAHDGENAIKKIEQTLPDLLLLDVSLPIIDGIGVLEYINSGKINKIPRVVTLSASGQDNIEKMMIEKGADYFMVKPIATQVLIKRILSIVNDAHNSSSNTYLLKEDNMLSVENEVFINKTIADYLIDLGFSTNLIGYEYTQKMLCMLLKLKSERATLTENYIAIAELYKSESKSVENAISSAIKAALKNRTYEMEKVLVRLNKNGKASVSNGIFLTTVVQILKYDIL